MSQRDDRANDSEAAPAGVDVTLIDEMLRTTVPQRLEQNDRMASLAIRLREAFQVGLGKARRTSAARAADESGDGLPMAFSR